MINVISLGAGVQSSTMALMAAHGEITPMPECAVFADTHDEPASVYRWLDYLAEKLPFPVHRVSAGSLSEKATSVRTSNGGKQYAQSTVPAYIVNPQGQVGIMMRQCTGNHKVVPIQGKLRELLGRRRMTGGVAVKQWIGISSDEAHRMKPSNLSWIENVWPLIDRWVSRNGCLAWLQSHGYPTPPP